MNIKVPVLLNHRIVEDNDNLEEYPPGSRPYCSTKSEFVEQICLLKKRGFKTITVSEIYSLKGVNNVALTFDDGFESDYIYALPELEKNNFKATFFIVTDFIGKKGYLDLVQIKELLSRGMEIGSHSVSHPCLLELDKKELIEELTQSKEVLEDKIGIAIDSFSVPFGFITNDIIEVILASGYKTVCTSESNLAIAGEKPMIYGRYGVRRGDSIRMIDGIITKDFATLARISMNEKAKGFMKTILGRKTWLIIREKILSKREMRT